MSYAHMIGLAFAFGVGAVLGWHVLRFLSLVGNALRHTMTLPDECAALRADLVGVLRDAGKVRGRPYPEWYVQWVAFRECAWL